VTELESRTVTALVIGGGVELDSGERLTRLATARGVSVITGRLGNRDIPTYISQELVPELRQVGTG